jgi:hypothetical protein
MWDAVPNDTRNGLLRAACDLTRSVPSAVATKCLPKLVRAREKV